jgi:ankyrin repeat protein
MLCDAANSDDVSALTELAKAGAPVTLADYDGRTALHVAAHAGHVNCVDWLLAHGAQVHARDRWNQTPLLSAVQGGHLNVVDALRRAGAHITLPPVKIGIELCAAAAMVGVRVGRSAPTLVIYTKVG